MFSRHETQQQRAPWLQASQMNAYGHHTQQHLQQTRGHEFSNNPAAANSALRHHQYVTRRLQVPAYASAATAKQHAPFDIAWSGEVASPRAHAAAHPMPQNQEGLAVTGVPALQQVHPRYEPGALLRATSQLPLLSHELTSGGLNSQSQVPRTQLSPHTGLQWSPPQQQKSTGTCLCNSHALR
jgi:hypothetical protein